MDEMDWRFLKWLFVEKINAEFFFIYKNYQFSKTLQVTLHRGYSSGDFDPENANKKLPVILKKPSVDLKKYPSREKVLFK
jgi:hypothetical protein